MQKINIFRAITEPELLFSLPLMYLFGNSNVFFPQLSLKSYYMWLTWHCLTFEQLFLEALPNNCLYISLLTLVFGKARKGGRGFVFSFLSGALLIGWVGSWPFEVLLTTGVFHDTKRSNLLFQLQDPSSLWFTFLPRIYHCLNLSPLFTCVIFHCLSLHENVSFLRAGSWPVLFFTALWVFSTWQAFK